jgi:hypothetical protein
MNHRNGSRACGNVEKMPRTLCAPVFVGSVSTGKGICGGLVDNFSSQVCCGDGAAKSSHFPIPQAGIIFRQTRPEPPIYRGDEIPCFRTKVRVFPRLGLLSTVFSRLSTVFGLPVWVRSNRNTQIWGIILM